MPEIKYFLKIIAVTAGGINDIIPAVAINPYYTLSFVTNSDTTIAIGFVSIDEANISGI